jgi:hypothetical protein
MPNEYREDPAGAVDPMLDPSARGLAEADPQGQAWRNHQLNTALAYYASLLGGGTLAASLLSLARNANRMANQEWQQGWQRPIHEGDTDPESVMDAVVHPTPGKSLFYEHYYPEGEGIPDEDMPPPDHGSWEAEPDDPNLPKASPEELTQFKNDQFPPVPEELSRRIRERLNQPDFDPNNPNWGSVSPHEMQNLFSSERDQVYQDMFNRRKLEEFRQSPYRFWKNMQQRILRLMEMQEPPVDLYDPKTGINEAPPMVPRQDPNEIWLYNHGNDEFHGPFDTTQAAHNYANVNRWPLTDYDAINKPPPSNAKITEVPPQPLPWVQSPPIQPEPPTGWENPGGGGGWTPPRRPPPSDPVQ